MKRYYDEGRQDAPEYQVVDRVYLDGANISTDRPLKKLDDKRYGDNSDADPDLYKDDPQHASLHLDHHLITQPTLVLCHTIIRLIYTF